MEKTFIVGFTRHGASISVRVPRRFAERKGLMEFPSFFAALDAVEDGEVRRPNKPLSLGERLLAGRRHRRSLSAFLRREAEARERIDPREAEAAARELLAPELLAMFGLAPFSTAESELFPADVLAG